MYYIGVIGAAVCDARIARLAEEVGMEIASAGAVLLCGGRGGVMEAAARGTRMAGGISIGILPGTTRSEGNPELTYVIPTGLGNARNAVIACASDALMAVAGGYGTLSEIGLALKMGKPVIGLDTWQAIAPGGNNLAVVPAKNALHAVQLALSLIKKEQ